MNLNMKARLASVAGVLVALLISTSSAMAQPSGPGGPPIVPPNKKTCTSDPIDIGGTPAASCTVVLVITAAGECPEGIAKYTISGTVSCPGERCVYPSQEVCGDATSIQFTGCAGATFTADTSLTGGGWSNIMGPGGDCDDIMFTSP